MSSEKFDYGAILPGNTIIYESMSPSPSTATLTFDLTDEDGQESFKDAIDGRSAGCAIWEIGQVLRNWEKYGCPEEFKTPSDVVESLREKYYEILSEREISRHGY